MVEDNTYYKPLYLRTYKSFNLNCLNCWIECLSLLVVVAEVLISSSFAVSLLHNMEEQLRSNPVVSLKYVSTKLEERISQYLISKSVNDLVVLAYMAKHQKSASLSLQHKIWIVA